MTAAIKRELISIEDYLAGELVSRTKHEYVGGTVYAMAGAINNHNLIAGNVFGTLHGRLSGKPCRPYNSDTKIRIRLASHTRFYYPDTSVICRPNSPTDSFQDEPTVLVEVLSKRTRRVDEGEKKEAYLAIPSLAVYLLIEQETPLVAAFRRGENGFSREIYEGLTAVIPLPEIETSLPLKDVYADAALTPEVDDD